MHYLYTVLFLVFAVCFHCSANTIVKLGESTTVRPLITASPGIVSSTLASASNITVTPTINSTAVPASTTTTSKPLTSSKGTTPGSTPASTTTKPTLAPNSSIVTTSAPHHERKFDGPSFVGGIILALSMVAIGFVALKFYKTRTELNYHTL
ncbi:sialomucin core protein 24-like isoform X2 [Dendroctonus ponderosae]|uniref:sialomucin core protein 24-like isoform X2 n=1 Tax=Dendroctonus ponderosae TaxID=77166 RepID=UPI00203557D8|nr:sialomucin core protein 24-like isoform X2 [Dendroctonus ponderosae]